MSTRRARTVIAGINAYEKNAAIEGPEGPGRPNVDGSSHASPRADGGLPGDGCSSQYRSTMRLKLSRGAAEFAACEGVGVGAAPQAEDGAVDTGAARP